MLKNHSHQNALKSELLLRTRRKRSRFYPEFDLFNKTLSQKKNHTPLIYTLIRYQLQTGKSSSCHMRSIQTKRKA